MNTDKTRTHYEALAREAAAHDDGAPAFPLATGQRQIGPHEYEYDVKAGMSLRDYFAAKAMQAYIAHVSCGGTESVSRCYPEIAQESYSIADAMLAARAGGAA